MDLNRKEVSPFRQKLQSACDLTGALNIRHYRQRRAGAGPKEKLRTDEDKLLFILIYQKTYPMQTMLGLQFEISQPQANYWIHLLLPS